MYIYVSGKKQNVNYEPPKYPEAEHEISTYAPPIDESKTEIAVSKTTNASEDIYQEKKGEGHSSNVKK